MEKELEKLLEENQLERVDIGEQEAENGLRVAYSHLESARLILDSDTPGSLQLSYDAARKALQAVLAKAGLRVRKPPRGNHFTFVRVSRSGLVDREIWIPLDWMREMRNASEYSVLSEGEADQEDAQQSIDAAQRMLTNAAAILNA
jgi:HEPN domain-containing protein